MNMKWGWGYERNNSDWNPWGCTHTHTHTHTGSFSGYLVWNKIFYDYIKTHVLYSVFCVVAKLHV